MIFTVGRNSSVPCFELRWLCQWTMGIVAYLSFGFLEFGPEREVMRPKHSRPTAACKKTPEWIWKSNVGVICERMLETACAINRAPPPPPGGLRASAGLETLSLLMEVAISIRRSCGAEVRVSGFGAVSGRYIHAWSDKRQDRDVCIRGASGKRLGSRCRSLIALQRRQSWMSTRIAK